jgi:hypothetical protein
MDFGEEDGQKKSLKITITVKHKKEQEIMR